MSSSCCFPKLEMSSIKLTNITRQRRHDDNPNRIISQYYESLIQEIDSYTKKRLAKSTDADILHAPTSSSTPNATQTIDEPIEFDFASVDDIWCFLREKIWTYYKTPIYHYKDELTNSCNLNSVVKWRKYLKQARSEMLTCLLDELAKAQSEAIDRYETIKGELAKRDEMSTDNEYVDEIEAQLFADKFYFLARFVPENKLDKTKFKMNLVVVDFYLNRFQRELLNHFQASSKQVFISFGDKLKSNEAKHHLKSNLTIDKDNLLIYLLFKYLAGLYESTSESAEVINSVVYVKQQQLISNMKLLKIDWHVLTKLCTTCFHPLSHLERLMLGRCDFANVSSDAFKSLVNLKFLELDEPHNCSHIDLNVLSKLKWLLFVDAYLAHQIPKTAHPKLEILEYHHDDSEHDHHALLEPESGFKPVETIRDFQFASLKVLRLKFKFNMDRFELDWISSLAGSLRYLSIESCRFRCFSLGNHTFDQLDSLRLDSNSLEEFEGTLDKLAHLKSLRISQNELKFRNDMFQGLENLKELSVTENGHRTFNNAKNHLNKIENCHVLRGLVNLETLDLSCNNLTYIEPELFAHLPNLDTLNLSSNKLNSSMVFAHLPRLRVLNLGMNNMGEQLSNGMFSEFVNLEMLDLKFNKISEIRREAFKGLDKLKILKIGCNRIKKLPLDSFVDLKNLIRIDLASNSIEENLKLKILELYSNVEILV